jgi:hypothetical protein
MRSVSAASAWRNAISPVKRWDPVEKKGLLSLRKHGYNFTLLFRAKDEYLNPSRLKNKESGKSILQSYSYMYKKVFMVMQ